jgi:hypothetical protein
MERWPPLGSTRNQPDSVQFREIQFLLSALLITSYPTLLDLRRPLLLSILTARQPFSKRFTDHPAPR